MSNMSVHAEKLFPHEVVTILGGRDRLLGWKRNQGINSIPLSPVLIKYSSIVVGRRVCLAVGYLSSSSLISWMAKTFVGMRIVSAIRYFGMHSQM